MDSSISEGRQRPRGSGERGGLGRRSGPFPPNLSCHGADAPWISIPRTEQNGNLHTEAGRWKARILGSFPGAFAGLGVQEHDVGGVDGGLLLQDAAALAGLGVRLGGLLDHVQAGHDHAVGGGADLGDGPRLALFLAGNDDDLIALLELHLGGGGFHYSTSGARETIFMYLRSRSSRATGPKTRVPTGSPSFLMMTAAFSSKRMYEPSLRRNALRWRTITAWTTAFFLTVPPGIASLTEAVITSPSWAIRPTPPPRGRMQQIFLAPELSATMSMVPI